MIQINDKPDQVIEYWSGTYTDSDGVEYRFNIKHMVGDVYDELDWINEVPDNEDDVRFEIGQKFSELTMYREEI